MANKLTSHKISEARRPVTSFGSSWSTVSLRIVTHSGSPPISRYPNQDKSSLSPTSTTSTLSITAAYISPSHPSSRASCPCSNECSQMHLVPGLHWPYALTRTIGTAISPYPDPPPRSIQLVDGHSMKRSPSGDPSTNGLPFPSQHRSSLLLPRTSRTGSSSPSAGVHCR